MIHFEDDVRNGLNGGNRDNGGPSNISYNSRDNTNDNLAVRLVLARDKNIKLMPEKFVPKLPNTGTPEIPEAKMACCNANARRDLQILKSEPCY